MYMYSTPFHVKQSWNCTTIQDRVNAVLKQSMDQYNFDVLLTKHGIWEIKLTRCASVKLLTEYSSATYASECLPLSSKPLCIYRTMFWWKINLKISYFKTKTYYSNILQKISLKCGLCTCRTILNGSQAVFCGKNYVDTFYFRCKLKIVRFDQTRFEL